MARDGPSRAVDARRNLHSVCSSMGGIWFWNGSRRGSTPVADGWRRSKQSVFRQLHGPAYADLLAHQTLLSLDAVVRTLVRRITHERMLEWETAAQAELGEGCTPVDRYIDWDAFSRHWKGC